MKINSAAALLQKQLPGLKIAVFDVFKPLYDIIADPKKNGNTLGETLIKHSYS